MWGTSGESLAHGFTFLTDGAQGMHHAVPRKLKITDGEVKQPYLIVRHYLNKTGFAQVAASRLVRFEMEVLDEPAS
jgi:CRISPR-associated protein (TIGR03984 family)